jgi:hypothetical protein
MSAAQAFAIKEKSKIRFPYVLKAVRRMRSFFGSFMGQIISIALTFSSILMGKGVCRV